MDVKYDPLADAAYVRLCDRSPHTGVDVDDRRRVDYSLDGQPVGIEFLGVSEGMDLSGLPDAEAVRHLLSERFPIFLDAQAHLHETAPSYSSVWTFGSLDLQAESDVGHPPVTASVTYTAAINDAPASPHTLAASA